MKLNSIVVSLGLVAASAATAQASSPEAWTELFKRASAACVKASELKKARAGTPVDFSDKVLVVVDGVYPQPHMKNAPARFVCLFDKRTHKAETNELPR